MQRSWRKVTWRNIGCIVMLTVCSHHAEAQFRATDEARLYQLNDVGEGLTCLADAGLPDRKWCGSPRFSPDGSRIVFDATPHFGAWHDSRIAVYHRTGEKAGKTEDLGLGNGPTWSADGTRIAFFMNPPPFTGLWVMHSDGTGRKRLGNGFRPVWSPDGRWVAAVARSHVLIDMTSGVPRPLGLTREGVGDVCWDRHGDQLTIVTRDDAGKYRIELLKRSEDFAKSHTIWSDGEGGLPEDADPFQPVWHPNGKQLLVRFGSQSARWGWGKHFLLPVPDPNSEPLPPQPFGHGTNPGYRADANWSPDGKHVIFTQCAVKE